jgi:hypothetical protein
MRINVENGMAVTLTGIRHPNINIDGQSFTGSESVIRAALLFEIEQITNTVSAMAADGEPTEDRIPFIEKRRHALTIIELLDGVVQQPSTEALNKYPVLINNNALTKDMADVLRQSLLMWKRYKEREPLMVGTLDTMSSYMLYGREETKARADAANTAKAS